MRDSFDRKIDYMRISITDRCNLRCTYCMPPSGIALANHSDMLSYEEILRLCEIFSKNGIKHYKITGGEPFARKGASRLIAGIKKTSGVESVTVTTNGLCLLQELPALTEAKIDCITISLDTLDKQAYKKLTGTDGLDTVLAAVDAVIEAGIPCKINCVPIKDINENQLLSIASLAKDKPLNVRFIEMMPIGRGKHFTPVATAEIHDMLKKSFGKLTLCDDKMGNGPAAYYSLPGFAGKIGFISSVTEMFCGSCNRLRLTSGGYLKTCLHHDIGVDLLAALRSGVPDEKIMELFSEAVSKKPQKHMFSLDGVKTATNSAMSQIGG